MARSGLHRGGQRRCPVHLPAHRLGIDDAAHLHRRHLLRRALPPPSRRAGRADRRFHAPRIDLVDHSALRLHGQSSLWGAVVYFKGRTPPRDSTEVYVVAKQWMWKLEHAEGQREINELHVPVGRDVKLIMTSQDVIHSFFVPAFRMKQDVLPGRYTVAWFRATKPGTYHLFCAAILRHAALRHDRLHHRHGARAVRSLDERRFHRPALRHRRKNLRRTRLRHLPSYRLRRAAAPTCRESSASPCNSKTGAPSPPTKITFANRILDPGAKVVKGFKPVMPTFQGLVSEEQLNALVAYVKSLVQPDSAAGSQDRFSVVPQGAPAQAASAARRQSTGKSGAMSMATATAQPRR